MKIKPEKKYIVCQAVDAQKLKSGIYLPDQKQDKKKYLQVIDSHSDKAKKDDFIVPKGNMMELEIEGKRFFIVYEEDVCAKIVND